MARNHRLADAGKAGRWAEVFEVLDLQWVSVNQSRLGGTSWFTPLHQAAWHGASVSVVTGLLDRGAFRALPPATAGRRTTSRPAAATPTCSTCCSPRTSLTPNGPPPSTRAASVIDGRLRLPEGIADSYAKPLDQCLRYPPVAVLPECPDERMWFAVPGMYGGFSIALMKGELPLRRVVDPRRRRLRPGACDHPPGSHAGRRGVRRGWSG